MDEGTNGESMFYYYEMDAVNGNHDADDGDITLNTTTDDDDECRLWGR